MWTTSGVLPQEEERAVAVCLAASPYRRGGVRPSANTSGLGIGFSTVPQEPAICENYRTRTRYSVHTVRMHACMRLWPVTNCQHNTGCSVGVTLNWFIHSQPKAKGVKRKGQGGEVVATPSPTLVWSAFTTMPRVRAACAMWPAPSFSRTNTLHRQFPFLITSNYNLGVLFYRYHAYIYGVPVQLTLLYSTLVCPSKKKSKLKVSANDANWGWEIKRKWIRPC